MKKNEVKKVAIQKAKVVMETLELILADSIKVTGILEFDSVVQGKEKVCTLEIYVPEKDYERHWLMDVPVNHSDVFYEQILHDLIENFGALEKVHLGDFYSIKYEKGNPFYGIKIKNDIGSTVSLNFIYKSNQFEALVTNYNEKRKELIQDSESLKR